MAGTSHFRGHTLMGTIGPKGLHHSPFWGLPLQHSPSILDQLPKTVAALVPLTRNDGTEVCKCARSSYPLRYEPITKGWAHNLFGCDLNRPSAEPLPCSSWAGKGLHVNNGGHAVHMKHENACSLDSMLYPTFGIWIELLPPRKTTDSQWVIKWMNEWIIMSVVFTITIISCVCFALKHYDELTPLL